MPSEQRPLWTTSRKLAGNILPLIIIGPLAILALILLIRDPISPLTLAIVCLYPFVAWLAVNFLGLTGNRSLKREMFLRYKRTHPGEQFPHYFVGYSRPKFQGFLDPHEDVGYLILYPDHLEVYGSARTIELPRAAIKEVRFRANPHSWILLGRWISIEAMAGDQALRLLIEPRESNVLFGNRRLSSSIKKELLDWLNHSGPSINGAGRDSAVPKLGEQTDHPS